MPKTFSLNDDRWRVGAVSQKPFGAQDDLGEVSEWLPAAVPGDVRLDLLRAGKIPHPYFGMNNRASQWVDTRDWWFVRDVEIEIEKDARVFLVFEGIDYQSAVLWNGVELGRHIGMFARQIYEIPRELQNGRAQLAVRVWGAGALPNCSVSRAERVLQEFGARLLPSQPLYPDRLATLKCQMSFGWDFAPRLRGCGIWDDASIVQTREGFIRDVWVKAVPDGRVNVMLSLDSSQSFNASARVRVRGKNFDGETQEFHFNLHLAAGLSQTQISFQLRQARLWNPWDRGEPNLYELELSLVYKSGELDSAVTTFGLRSIELAPNPGAPREEPPWTFVVNGHPEFIRGANWVPADALPGRLGREDYGALLQFARAANINLLRVWGGGLREKRAFYDLCDENGILVWQDFPFSVAPLDHFPRDAEFLALVRAECGDIIRALRNHPSLALWCGGNEFNPRANRHLVNTLRALVAEQDGTRPFKPGSPSRGERHNWRVWHGFANTRDYRKDDAGFFGEFGLQAPPDSAVLARFIPQEQLWQPGEAWVYHNAELEKLWRYARALNPAADSLEEFVHASQLAQLRGLQVMIEHARRHKPRVSGCAFWQFNEPWPSICWSVLDYSRRPKPAYFKIKELYNPVLISFDYPLVPRAPGERVSGKLVLINDELRAVHGELRAELNGVPVLSMHIQAGPNSVANVGNLQVKMTEGINSLKFFLEAQGKLISTNEYDLNYCDVGEISWRKARAADIGARLMS